MDYVLRVAVGVGAAIGVGVYLLGQYWQDRARDDVQQAVRGRQAQARFQSARENVPVDFGEYRAPWELKRFIQDQVIPGLNFQRNDRNTDQFAAVILSDKKLDQINELRLHTYNGQLVNSDKSSHPDSPNLVNYIVARPDHRGHHAEEVLLDRFNELWQKFRRRPSLILLFSWLMPCNECTEAIINRLGNLCAQYQVIVVFRSNYKLYTPQVNEENREKLSAANFRVYHVSYAENLPRN